MPTVDRILTTHVGSLIRPPEVLAYLDEIERGGEIDDTARDATLTHAVAELVHQQTAAGIDVVSDGEVGKVNWISYLYERLSGLEVKAQKPGASFMPPSRDRQQFPEFYAEDDAVLAARINRVSFIGEKGVRARRGVTPTGPEVWTCTGPITYDGQALLQRDINRLKAALAGTSATAGFLPVVAPASTYWLNNEYYKTDDELVFALADALHVEYTAIAESGLFLQVDDAVLVHEYDSILSRGGSVADYRCWAQLRIDALKHALRGIPPERVRYHVCWGSWHGPHAFDPPLAEVVDFVLQVPARYYLIEQGNPRHEHEWKLWETVTLPDDKVLVPGVVTHHTNIVEHPELVAQRLTRLAKVVGRERVMGGTDCGFAQGAYIRRVHPSIQWAKLRALAEGAALATRELWGA
ncbi:MAG TPA: cobalamin-independent methionine synthase II family protein [Vicinamibacterales bacterium]|jgi:5-methyltetrahydropteroyltriglutamate--homocysteine methyltransferase|nr:cobalamin-independent methionine synthase II family protein [Vicinamibacterales bacterium]